MSNSRNKRNLVKRETKLQAKQLRRMMTPSEKILWNNLKKDALGARFHRQAVVWGYIVDFWCPKYSFAVELDGHFHNVRKKEDAQRDYNLKNVGIETLRFPSKWVFTNLDSIILVIKNYIEMKETYNSNLSQIETTSK